MMGRDGAITPREPLGNHQHEGQWMRHWMECTWWQVGGGLLSTPISRKISSSHPGTWAPTLVLRW